MGSIHRSRKCALGRLQKKAARPASSSGCGSRRGPAASVLSAGCKKKPPAPPPPPVVEVVEVQPQDVPIYHDWIGSLDGLVNAQIRAQVNGYLLSQNYREGDSLKKGDLLFQIDPRPFEAALEQAKGQLAQAEAQFDKTELDVK